MNQMDQREYPSPRAAQRSHSKEIGNEYKLTSSWSDAWADLKYTLTVFTITEDGEKLIVNRCSGDKEWAKRIAKHYNIEESK